MRSETISPVPAFLAGLLRPLPLAPLHMAVQHLVAHVGQAHPGLFARLGHHAGKRFLVDPIDLPFVFLLIPDSDRPTAEPRRRGERLQWDARIGGRLAALLGMVHGAFDGDALFFSGDLVIEGDTEAVLALRNALDDSELDLLGEAAASLGPLADLIVPLARRILPTAQWLTGLALTRVP